MVGFVLGVSCPDGIVVRLGVCFCSPQIPYGEMSWDRINARVQLSCDICPRGIHPLNLDLNYRLR